MLLASHRVTEKYRIMQTPIIFAFLVILAAGLNEGTKYPIPKEDCTDKGQCFPFAFIFTN